jgi:aldehyde dehydrogenase (NAD+)
MKARERKRILDRIAHLARANAGQLNHLQTMDNGLPVSAHAMYPLGPEYFADTFEHYAGWIDKLGGQTLPDTGGADDVIAMTLRDPVGVVAQPILQEGRAGARGRLHYRAEAVGVRQPDRHPADRIARRSGRAQRRL